MDRQIVYPGAIPLETDLLKSNKYAMLGLSKLAAAILGTSTMLNGLACVPGSPASLNVNVAAGEIYSLQNVDGTAYSSLAADTAHQIVKQGIRMDAGLLSCPAPGTAGQSINYLIQVTYTDTDSGATVLPYYNASNPTQAYSGPANSGTAQNTVRNGVCTVAVKAGIAATTGTQTTPAPDAGYVGAWVVTVANGQTTITSGNISQYAGAPFLSSAGMVVGGFQGQAFNTSAAGGTANAVTGAFAPGITALTNGMMLFVRAASANATTTPTFTPNAGTIAAKSIVKGNGLALSAGDIAGAGHWIALQYDATLDKWVLLNPATGVTVGGLRANGTQGYTASASLGLADFGRIAVYSSGTTGTLTLPDPTIAPAGSIISISNVNIGVCTVASLGAVTNIYGYSSSSGVSSVPLNFGEAIMLVTNGVSWNLVIANKLGAAGITASGYQRFGSTLIIQWGSIASLAAGANQAVTFPIAFPTAVYSVTTGVQLGALGPASNRYNLHVVSPTTTGFTAENSDTGAAGYNWIAIGQ